MNAQQRARARARALSPAAQALRGAEQRARASVPDTWPHADTWRDVLAGNARAHVTYAVEQARATSRAEVRRARTDLAARRRTA